MAYDIFISYRRQGGADKARSLKSELENRNYKVFLDFDELKDGVFDQRIMDAIDEAPIFMVILSAHSLDRCNNDDDWVRREIEYAVMKNRHMVPVNPNKEFDGFPTDVPQSIREGLGQHQFSHIDFEQLFKASIDKMISERIEPLISKRYHNSNPNGALLRIDSDIRCHVLRFGKNIATIDTGISEIRLPKGKQKITFVSVEYKSVQIEHIFDIQDLEYEDYFELKLLEQCNKLKNSSKRTASSTRQSSTTKNTSHSSIKQVSATKTIENKSSLDLWIQAAKRGDIDSQTNLGDYFFYGKGVEKNYTEAAKWYLKAAEQGDRYAQYSIGYCYYYGEGVEKNYTEAAKWYLKAANQGDASAQKSLGNCYYYGRGVEKNYTEAAKWYLKAANQGDASAQNSLGSCYYYGRGVEKNYTEAVKWYLKAVEQGNASAQNGLGSCYYYGRGVEKNYTEAVKWYLKAAEQGNRYAQYSIGYCYYYGEGVEKNYTEAAKWFRKAAEQGYEEAIKMLNRLK